MRRYFHLVETVGSAARLREPAPPVSIDMPKEQTRLAQALVQLANEAGMEHSGGPLTGSTYRQLQVYFTGRRIPGNDFLTAFVMKWKENTESGGFLDTFGYLEDLARDARAARARDRRAERGRISIAETRACDALDVQARDTLQPSTRTLETERGGRG